jgi:ABC-type anion transport system duplicated permease subunit
MIQQRFMVVMVPASPENDIYKCANQFIRKIIVWKGYSNRRSIVTGFSISYRRINILIIISLTILIAITISISIACRRRVHRYGHRNTSGNSKNK